MKVDKLFIVLIFQKIVFKIKKGKEFRFSKRSFDHSDAINVKLINYIMFLDTF